MNRALKLVSLILILACYATAFAILASGQDAKKDAVANKTSEQADKSKSSKAETSRADSKSSDSKSGDLNGDAKKDDSKTAGNDKAPAEKSFAELFKQYQDLETKLVDAEVEFQKETDAAKLEKIRVAYEMEANRLIKLAPDLRSAAIKEYKAMPGNEKALRLLVGMLVNDISTQDDEKAIELAQALFEGKCDKKHFDAIRGAQRLSPGDVGLVEEIMKLRADFEKDDLPRVKITTSQGDVVVELFEDEAPNTVANFISLVEKKFYEGSEFHRVIKDFVAQGGSEKGSGGSKGPGYSIKCECEGPNARRHWTGYLSMAHAGKDTGGAQFYMIYSRARTQHLDQKHTVFGRIISGMENVRKLKPTSAIDASAGDKPDIIVKAEILRKRDHEYKPVVKPDEKPEDEDSDKK